MNVEPVSRPVRERFCHKSRGKPVFSRDESNDIFQKNEFIRQFQDIVCMFQTQLKLAPPTLAADRLKGDIIDFTALTYLIQEF